MYLSFSIQFSSFVSIYFFIILYWNAMRKNEARKHGEWFSPWKWPEATQLDLFLECYGNNCTCVYSPCEMRFAGIQLMDTIFNFSLAPKTIVRLQFELKFKCMYEWARKPPYVWMLIGTNAASFVFAISIIDSEHCVCVLHAIVQLLLQWSHD